MRSMWTMGALLVAVAVCGQALADGPTDVPLGHKDFYPSPDRPVGFRGDGNGWFPGATPVSTWQEGTPVRKSKEVTRRGRPRKMDYWEFSDETSKNIVWKVAMPAWANTQPIVVGDRVFTYGEPDMLICVDAYSGKVLWTRTVNPWEAAGLAEDKATLCRELSLIALALDKFIEVQFHFNTCGRYMPSQKYLPMLNIFLGKELPHILAELKKLDPEGGYDGPAKEMVAQLQAYQKEPLEGRKCQGYDKKVNQLKKRINQRIVQISGIKVPMDHPWGNMVGWNMSVPVSDGRHVFVQMGQGQTACFDLNGKLLWQKWFEQDKVSTHHVLSPLLAGDVMVDMHGGGTLRGLDKATGKVLWEAPTAKKTKSRRGGYYVASHRVVHLDGEAYIVTSQCSIIRARDGKPVGEVDYGNQYGGGAPVAGVGDTILKCANGDGWSRPFKAFQLVRTGPDTVIAKLLWEAKASGGYETRIMTPSATYLCSRRGEDVVDTRTGKKLLDSRGFGRSFHLLAGNMLIARDGGQRDPLGSHWSDRREDGKVMIDFETWDVSDPAHPKKLSGQNVLGGENQPRMPSVEKYLPNLWPHPEFYNAKGGKPAHMVHTDTCTFPQGNRLFIRTVSHLYCIGDPEKPYDWNPQSRPDGVLADK